MHCLCHWGLLTGFLLVLQADISMLTRKVTNRLSQWLNALRHADVSMTMSSDSKRKHFCGQELLKGKYFLYYYTLKVSTLFLKRHLATFSKLKLSQLKMKLIASFTYLIVVSFDEFFFLKHHLWPFLHYDFFNWNDIVIILNTLCLLQMYTLNFTFRSTIYKIEIENNQHFWQAIVVYFVFKASFMASFLDTISFSFLIV